MTRKRLNYLLHFRPQVWFYLYYFILNCLATQSSNIFGQLILRPRTINNCCIFEQVVSLWKSIKQTNGKIINCILLGIKMVLHEKTEYASHNNVAYKC